jgi:hypothetical protein
MGRFALKDSQTPCETRILLSGADGDRTRLAVVDEAPLVARPRPFAKSPQVAAWGLLTLALRPS